MPIYQYKCNKCGKVKDISLPILMRNQVFSCSCGGDKIRQITAPAVKIFKPYVHENLDEHPVYIESAKQEREEFAKRGLINGTPH